MLAMITQTKIISQMELLQMQSQQEGAFVIVEKALDGSYKIADEFPAAKTTIVLRNPDGTERILSQEEIDKLVKRRRGKNRCREHHLLQTQK